MALRSVIITGGAGYVGSHVAQSFLEAGYRVTVLDDLSRGALRMVPAGAQFVQGDVADGALVAALVKKTGASGLLHLAASVDAAQSFADPDRHWRNNAAASLALFQAALKAGIERIVLTSTAAVYAPHDGAFIDEASALGPVSPYGRSKLAAEWMLKDLCARWGAHHAVLRCFNVAGADPAARRGQLSRVSSQLIKAACEVACGKRPALQIHGADYATRDGTCLRDYIHVADLADLHLLAFQRLADGGDSFTANCGYGEGATVLEVIKAVERIVGRPLRAEIAPRRLGDAPAVVADSRLIRGLLDWRPRWADLDGIVETAWRWEQRC